MNIIGDELFKEISELSNFTALVRSGIERFLIHVRNDLHNENNQKTFYIQAII